MCGLVLLLTGAVLVSGAVLPSDKESECYANEKVYHAAGDKCYKLLTKGPCESGEWLVLEKPRKDERNPEIRPVCAKEKCRDGEYYWPGTGTCVEAKDKEKLCRKSAGEELLNNVFGEGECSCATEPPRARLHGVKKNPCHQLYTRGPCQAGQVLVLPEGELTKAVCESDPCHKESVQRRKSGTLSKDGVLAPFKNGTCYELGMQGPCEKDFVFKVHASLLKPSCVSLTTNIFSLQKPQNCYQDENGDCQKRIHSVYKHPVCASLVSHIFVGVKQCPMDENGDCQKEVTRKKDNNYLKELHEFLKN